MRSILGWMAYRSGAYLLLRRIHRDHAGPGVRILFYHRVVAPPVAPDLLGRKLLTAGEFRKHLRHLRRFYHVISLADAVEALQAKAPLPDNAVVITFDDGFQDNYTVALPLLEQHGLPATFFLVTSALDGRPFWFEDLHRWFRETNAAGLTLPGSGDELSLAGETARQAALRQAIALLKGLPARDFSTALDDLRRQLGVAGDDSTAERLTLTRDELRSMTKSSLVTIGAHTVTHPILLNLESTGLPAEIAGSRDELSALLGKPVRFFAYPNGDCNMATRSLVRELGLVGCAVGGGGFNPPGSDLTLLGRTGAEGLPLFRFALYLAGVEDLTVRLIRRLLACRRGAKRLVYRLMAATGVFAVLRHLNRRRLVVVLYHGVSSAQDGVHLDNLHVGRENFRRQMQWLRRKFTPITLERALEGLDGGSPLPSRPLVLTFDDAYRNNLETAWPILAELGIPATIFVPTAFVGTGLRYWAEELEARLIASNAQAVKIPLVDGELVSLRSAQDRQAAFWKLSQLLKGLQPAPRKRVVDDLHRQLASVGDPGDVTPIEPRLDWSELRRLNEQGFTIGSHTVSHALLPGLAPDQVAAELRESKGILESELGVAVRAFAYPNGDWSPEVRKAVEKAGYSCSFTTEAGTNDARTDRHLLKRISINSNDDLSEVMSAVSGFAGTISGFVRFFLGVFRPRPKPGPKILEISNYPPPQCGWAMQTKLLTEELRRRGAVCEVMNINEGRKIKSPEYVDVQNGRDYLAKVVKFSLRGFRVHTHVNAESPKGYVLALTANLIGRLLGKSPAMTFHGGLPQTFFPRPDSRLVRFAFKLLFASAGKITCDNQEMKAAIQSYGFRRKPIEPVACFSPEYLSFEVRPLDPTIEVFLADRNPVLFCFVCFRPEYALDSLLAGMDRFTQRQPRAGFIWLGFPRKELAPAKAYLEARPGGHPSNLLLLGNLDHDTFLTLLNRCTAYVRPAACDGISASVLESLGLGVPVVAAENGRRPAGVVTYRFADPDDLSAKLEYVTRNYQSVKRATRLPEAVENSIGRAADFLLQEEARPIHASRAARYAD